AQGAQLLAEVLRLRGLLRRVRRPHPPRVRVADLALPVPVDRRVELPLEGREAFRLQDGEGEQSDQDRRPRMALAQPHPGAPHGRGPPPVGDRRPIYPSGYSTAPPGTRQAPIPLLHEASLARLR